MIFRPGPIDGERSLMRRSTNTTRRPVSNATVTQTSTRADCANQPIRSSSHWNEPRGSMGSESELCAHFRDRMVFSGARLGSAFTASMALVISARVGARPTGAAWMDSPVSSNASATALSLERTAQFLLDVPRFQLRATVQIHGKARGHIERLEEQHNQRKSARYGESQVGECTGRKWLALARREPEYQRHQRYCQNGLGHTERGGHQSGWRRSAPSYLHHALAGSEQAQALELIHGLRE